MKILFITSNRLGDAVLSTGVLRHINDTYPEARVTIACGGLPSTLFEEFPQLEKLIILKKQKFHKHWLGLWRQVVGTKWDMVIDLRDSIVSRTICTKRRFIHSKALAAGPNGPKHKVEQAAAIMRLKDVPPPKLWLTTAQEETAAQLMAGEGFILGIGPTANWVGKTWPKENFAAVTARLTGESGIMEGARVAIFAAPGEEEAAQYVLETIPAERRIDLIAKLSPGEAASCLKRCDFYIGNDSGLMHTAAAVGTPTVGLFGPSYPQIYAPYGPHCAYAQTHETFDELIDYPGYTPQTAPCLMTSLSVETVLEVIERHFRKEHP